MQRQLSYWVWGQTYNSGMSFPISIHLGKYQQYFEFVVQSSWCLNVDCECQLLFTLSYQLAWPCWCSVLQLVSGCCPSVFQAYWWCMSYTLQSVGSCCAYVSSLLMMPALCSSASEWVLCLAVCQACWWSLSSALQSVSSCCALLCFKPADEACFLLRMWMAAVPYCVSNLLMKPVLCSPECEWLLCLSVFQACLCCWHSTLQWVSGCYAVLV